MAESTRVERLADQARIEISDILRRMKDPRIGFVSVTEVEATGDMRQLRVYVSVLGTEEEQAQTMEALEHAKGFVRTELGSRIRLRYTPEVTFRYDPSLERGARITGLLARLKAEEPAGGSDKS